MNNIGYTSYAAIANQANCPANYPDITPEVESAEHDLDIIKDLGANLNVAIDLIIKRIEKAADSIKDENLQLSTLRMIDTLAGFYDDFSDSVWHESDYNLRMANEGDE